MTTVDPQRYPMLPRPRSLPPGSPRRGSSNSSLVDNGREVQGALQNAAPRRISQAELLSSYLTLVQELDRKISKEVDWDKPKKKGFIPPGAARQILDNHTLKTVYDTLSPPDHVLLPLSKNEFIKAINGRRLHEFLASMILAHCDRDAVLSFVQQLLVQWPNDLPDPLHSSTNGLESGDAADEVTLLPLAQEQVQTILGTDDVDHFMQKQWLFSGIVLKIYTENQIDIDQSSTRLPKELPYLDEESIGTGSFGSVWKVRIAKGHLKNLDKDSAGPESMTLARKDLKFESDESRIAAKRERGIMDAILNNPSRQSKNVVQYYGSVSNGLSYSILMSLGDFNLRTYMEKHPHPPKSRAERLQLLSSAIGLAEGLNFLHSMDTPTYKSIALLHLDIKPANVIVKENGTWQLGDFGLSQIKYRHLETGSKKRSRGKETPSESSFSRVETVRAEGTYQPPEANGSRELMLTKKSDIWSLGCVLISVLAYIVGGLEKLDEFANKRGADRRAWGTDRFFLKNDMFGPQLNGVVRHWFKTPGDLDPREATILRELNSSLGKTALQIEQGRRGDAGEIKELLRTAFTEISSLPPDDAPGEPSSSSPPRGSTRSWQNIPHFLGALFARNSTYPALGVSVNACEITPGASDVFFKGCAIPDDLSFVAYWTKLNIYIYGSLWTDSGNSGPEEKKALARSEPADGEKPWTSVSLTPRLLAACTEKSNICYIFKLRNSVHSKPELSRVSKIPLAVDEISQIAVSRNDLELACVVGKDGKSYLFHFEIAALFETERLRSEGYPAEAQPRKSVPLQWAASAISQLEFSDDNSVYLVAMQGHHITRVDLASDKQIDLSLRDICHYNSMAQEPYTCFIPYDQGYSGAAVTGERRIRLPVFNNALAARTQVISEFRVSSHHIVGLMFGKKRQTLYALGAKHEGGVISLLEVRVPTTDSPGQFTILELAKLDKLRHGGQFVAKLEEYVPEDALEGVLDTHVVVASLSGVASRPVYTIIMKL